MHELKTPIAKGRIVSELIDNEKQKGRIITIFEKLNSLIDDFAKVEQVVSENYEPIMHHYSMNKIISNATEMLLIDTIDNIILQDISDKKVILKQESNQLLVISNGKKLEKPLSEYYKPFHTDIKNKNHGMGLGLYIVHSIVQMQNMHLKYIYKENQNYFKIIF